ncbi:MAG: acyl-CoA dehydratase activase [Candidatus Eisenbacteria bacterium]
MPPEKAPETGNGTGMPARGPTKHFVGIDSGSWTTKAVVIDETGTVLGSAVVQSAADLTGASARALEQAASRAGVAFDEATIWATGFGRASIEIASGSRTELDCHARGVRHYVRGALAVLDIGGQDAKVIKLDEQGHRVSHKMNRKCAAGTGSFLDEIALRLGVPVSDLGDLASGYREELELGSFCTVFTATELLGAIRQGKRPADLARAAYKSIVKRVLEMAQFDRPVVATGGVIAHHPMVVALLTEALGRDIVVPPHPQEMGAFGAALAARDAASESPQHARG